MPVPCTNQLNYEATDVGSWSIICSCERDECDRCIWNKSYKKCGNEVKSRMMLAVVFYFIYIYHFAILDKYLSYLAASRVLLSLRCHASRRVGKKTSTYIKLHNNLSSKGAWQVIIKNRTQSITRRWRKGNIQIKGERGVYITKFVFFLQQNKDDLIFKDL